MKRIGGQAQRQALLCGRGLAGLAQKDAAAAQLQGNKLVSAQIFDVQHLRGEAVRLRGGLRQQVFGADADGGRALRCGKAGQVSHRNQVHQNNNTE